MKIMDIFKKTMPFVWTRFGLYLLLGVGIIAYYIIAALIVLNGAESGLSILGIIILVLGIIIYAAVSRYLNYMVKAAHVAVIAELSATGTVPEGMSIVKYGKEQVKKRFVTANVFYAVDGLVSGAVSQLQRIVSSVGSWFEKIPVMKTIFDIINLFIGIVLGYVDEAVLAHIFRKKDESAWKGAADGVVLYFESWKEILKNAVGLVLLVIGFYLVGGGIVYLILNAILTTAISVDSVLFFLIALISAFVIINAFKVSFLDSWITISVVNRYTQVTYNKQPQFDLYGKAKGWSRSFNKICSKAEADGVVVGAPVVAAGGVVNAAYQQPVYGQPVQQAPVQQPVYGQPMQQAPVQQPVYGQPMQQAPVQQPVYGQQMQQAPVQQPVYGQPMQQAPVQQPVYGQQMQQAPVQQPVYGQPVQQNIPNNNQNGNL